MFRKQRRRPMLRWIAWSFAIIFTPILAMAAYEPGALIGTNNLSDLASASTARTNLGLGSAATAAASSFFAVANNLSEGTAATMRTNIGVGTISTQAANSVAITGGAIDGTTIGATTTSTIKATTGNFSGILTTGSGVVRAIRVVTGSGTITAATTDDIISINKSVAAATALTMPSSPTTGQTICVKDDKGDANTNNITVSPAAGNIDGASTYVMKQNFQAACFIYDAAQWEIL